MNCTKCVELQRDLEAAERAGDRTKAVDCRVLLRRHPQHDGVAVEIGALPRTRGDEKLAGRLVPASHGAT
ncbi:hypothetical protein Sliba_15290 [Streptomyces nigrescens]|uniref:Uncharacterized protein n=1 Tax=Streptomyces nigrescens TaxID=1920 RepID=A0A640TFQ6_STRNI|nr:hypothetical protein Sliba_15290 [Streptomyces libani subsp. libani]GGV88897.1 hypothetical protein GCM10010500_12690 [Streptomyces libani subsp. libani]